MKLKKTLSVLLLASTVACFKVPAGNVGIKVDLFGKDKGVQTQELGVGRYMRWVNTDYYLFPTYTQNYKWLYNNNPKYDESIKFQSMETLSMRADIGISYSIDQTKITTLFVKYRKGIEEITDLYLRNIVANSFLTLASTKTVEEINQNKMNLINEVEKDVRKQVSKIGINVENIYYIGEIFFPPSIVESINAKIVQTQKAQEIENKVREEKAKTEIAIEKGKQDTIRGKALKNNPALLEKKRLEVKQEWIDKWDGRMPTHILGSNSSMMIGQ